MENAGIYALSDHGHAIDLKIKMTDKLRIETIRMNEDMEWFLLKYPHYAAS